MRVLFIPSRLPQDLRRGDEAARIPALICASCRGGMRSPCCVRAAGRAVYDAGRAGRMLRACRSGRTESRRQAGARVARTARIAADTGRGERHACVPQCAGATVAQRAIRRRPRAARAHGQVLPLLGDLPCVLDLVDALSLNMASRAGRDAGRCDGRPRSGAARLLPYERGLCARAAAALVSSARDRAALGKRTCLHCTSSPTASMRTNSPSPPSRAKQTGSCSAATSAISRTSMRRSGSCAKCCRCCGRGVPTSRSIWSARATGRGLAPLGAKSVRRAPDRPGGGHAAAPGPGRGRGRADAREAPANR